MRIMRLESENRFENFLHELCAEIVVEQGVKMQPVYLPPQSPFKLSRDSFFPPLCGPRSSALMIINQNSMRRYHFLINAY